MGAICFESRCICIIGITGVESNLGTAIRTGVVLVMAFVIVFIKGKQSQIKAVDKKELGFIALSGLATVSVVVPLDKVCGTLAMAVWA